MPQGAASIIIAAKHYINFVVFNYKCATALNAGEQC